MIQEFNNDAIFEYNYWKKIRFIIYLLAGVILLLGVIGYYYFFVRHMDNVFVDVINAIMRHVGVNVADTHSLLGAFYATAIGGLFFIPLIPVEVGFIASLTAGLSPIVLILVYTLGLILAYFINYKIGEIFSEISKKIITPKRFYKIKVVLNKYGMIAIFVFNLLPLPAQPLSAILGVFKYNQAKFYIAFISGVVIKFIVIAIAYFYIL